VGGKHMGERVGKGQELFFTKLLMIPGRGGGNGTHELFNAGKIKKRREG